MMMSQMQRTTEKLRKNEQTEREQEDEEWMGKIVKNLCVYVRV